MDQLLGLVDLVFSVGQNQTVQILFLVAGVCGIGTTFSFLDGSLTTDSNLGTGLGLHFLERVTTRSNEETDWLGELGVSGCQAYAIMLGRAGDIKATAAAKVREGAVGYTRGAWTVKAKRK